uniref:Uncharacterized protein n=1 Tax=Panagrolaimus sp. JU765 TaxID=591449 RepID=A0AC34RLI5_9BILA
MKKLIKLILFFIFISKAVATISLTDVSPAFGATDIPEKYSSIVEFENDTFIYHVKNVKTILDGYLFLKNNSFEFYIDDDFDKDEVQNDIQNEVKNKIILKIPECVFDPVYEFDVKWLGKLRILDFDLPKCPGTLKTPQKIVINKQDNLYCDDGLPVFIAPCRHKQDMLKEPLRFILETIQEDDDGPKLKFMFDAGTIGFSQTVDNTTETTDANSTFVTDALSSTTSMLTTSTATTTSSTTNETFLTTTTTPSMATTTPTTPPITTSSTTSTNSTTLPPSSTMTSSLPTSEAPTIPNNDPHQVVSGNERIWGRTDFLILILIILPFQH